MKIRELYLRNFGKFSGKKIVLKDGINLFYGENESGKTTIHTFIKSMLFGLERGRGRASVMIPSASMNRGRIRIIIPGHFVLKAEERIFYWSEILINIQKAQGLFVRMTERNFRWSTGI